MVERVRLGEGGGVRNESAKKDARRMGAKGGRWTGGGTANKKVCIIPWLHIVK